MTENQFREPAEIEALLPWYATGRLNAAEMLEVESYLAAHPEARRFLALIREEQDEAIGANEGLGLPSSAARDRLMAAIAADQATSVMAPGFWQRVKDAFAAMAPAGLSPGVAFGGALAALVIVVQAGTLVALLGGEPGGDGNGTGLAGREQPTTTGTFLLVRFANDAKASDIAMLLKSTGAVIVDGPKPGNAFKLRISDEVLSEADRAAIMAKLRERSDIVSLVAPAG